jgi:tetraacyldisaccharide 4'-kinase
LRFLLSPVSYAFAGISAARRTLYQKGIFQIHDLEAPVVSVGNLTVGGTGKTPLVAFAAKVLAENGHKVCVLTRGYKRRNPNERVLVSDGSQILSDVQSSGDEPFELANKLLGTAAVIADKNRVEAGNWAKKNLGATAFVLDDGFQHLRLKRNLDIVTIDATNPFGNVNLLPYGILREPLTALKRADVVVLTRSNLSERISDLKTRIAKYNSDCPILSARNEIQGLATLESFLTFPAKAQSSQSFNFTCDSKGLAFCALGNPAAFFQDLRAKGFNPVAKQTFSDHHAYTQFDVEKIEQKASASGAEFLVTTFKDAVKLRDLKFSLPCFVAEAEMFFDNAEPLLKLLRKL